MTNIATGFQTIIEQTRTLGRRATLVGATAFLWVNGCSLQSYSYLQRGSADTGGSTSTDGEGGATSSGGSESGGTSGSGAASEAGASAGGGAAAGSDAGGAGATAGAPNPAGAAGSAGSAGSAVAGSTSCVPFTPPAGVLLKPPSTGFEEEVTWSTVASNSFAVSRVPAADACEGSTYLTCTGSARMGGWDGPAVEALGYLVPGHKYAVSLVTRFSASNAPTVAKAVGLTFSMSCSDATIVPVYPNLQKKSVFTNWTRLSGQFTATLAECADLSRLVIYVETDAADKSFSLDVDDFSIYDVTPPS